MTDPGAYWTAAPLADIRPEVRRPRIRIYGAEYEMILPQEWDPYDMQRMQQASRLWDLIGSGQKAYEALTAAERKRLLADVSWILSRLCPDLPVYVMGGLALLDVQRIIEAWNQFSRDYVKWLEQNAEIDIVGEAMAAEATAGEQQDPLLGIDK